MADAVERVSKALEAIAEASQASASALAADLGISRQAAGRLLESLIESGLVVRDKHHFRLTLGLRVHSWGSKAVTQYLPSGSTRAEIARLAHDAGHPVFYMAREGEWVYTIEQTQPLGGLIVTKPSAGRNHWSSTTTGRVLVAFADPAERQQLFRGIGDDPAKELSEALEAIRSQGFGVRHTTATRYTIAAPILDDRGLALGVLAVVVTNDESEKEQLITMVRDTAARCAFDLSHEILSAVL